MAQIHNYLFMINNNKNIYEHDSLFSQFNGSSGDFLTDFSVRKHKAELEWCMFEITVS